MDIWQWVHDDHTRAVQSGNRGRIEMVDLLFRAMRIGRIDPDQELSLLRAGRALAEAQRAPWWVIMYDHWQLQTLLHRKRDYAAALDVAVRAAVQTRQAEYQGVPQRVCVHEDLITAYVNLDPDGHAAEIQSALDYMGREIAPGAECRFCLNGLRTTFALARGRLDTAQAFADQALAAAQADGEAHHEAGSYEALCDLALRRGRWSALRDLARAGEAVARGLPRTDPMQLGGFLAWQAAAEIWLSNRDDAARLLRSALAQFGQTQAVPSGDVYDVLCAYHTASGELDKIRLLRARQVNESVASGSPCLETQARLRLCQVLAEMGTLTTADLASARAAANRLRDPSPALKTLDTLTPP